MLNIGDYAANVRLVLVTGGMYFAMLLLVVLAVRFWRRLPKLPGRARVANFFLACLVTAAAVGTGYVSVCHSMSLMYWQFGLKAFQASRVDSAFSLFDTSWKYHPTADALGAKGVCLLVTGHGGPGISLLEAAKSLRQGKESPFENYYEGLYHFYADDPTNAIPLLEQASADPQYAWEATKLFAVFQLDHGQPQAAARLMQPYLQAQVSEPEHAYILARLKLADGELAGARALADKFQTAEMPPYWRKRFDQLEAELQNRKT
jgi:hypothetical protein